MNAVRVVAVFRRIVAQFRRDPRSLALLFVAPLAIIALLGWVLSSEGSGTARVAVVNESAGPAGAVLATKIQGALDGQPGMALDRTVADDSAARQALKDKKLDLVVVLPTDFSVQNRKFELLTLGLNPPGEASVLPAIQKALLGSVADTLGVALPTFERATVYGSPNATQLDTLAPVVVGFFATLQVAIVLAFVLGRFDIPALGPIPAFAIGLGVRTIGNPLIAYFLVLILGLGAVSLGIFLSTFARTELQILQFIPIVIVPQGLLGGFFWPIDQLPDLLQPVARILPVTYAIDGLRQVMIAGADLSSSQVLLDLGVLSAIAAVFVALAAGTIRREVA